MESNRQGREDQSRVTLTPDVIMHVLRLQRRQTVAYIERRYSRDDIESDEANGEAYVLGLSDGNASLDEDSRKFRGLQHQLELYDCVSMSSCLLLSSSDFLINFPYQIVKRCYYYQMMHLRLNFCI